MPKVRSPKDFVSGLLFAAIGLCAILIGNSYPTGTAAHMGPGYFPRMLGILLMLLGSALTLRALRLTGTHFPLWKWRPTVVVLGSVVLFGAIVIPIGLFLSTIILILLSSSASSEFKIKEAFISSVVLAAIVVGIFVFGLNLQLPIWPGAR